MEYLAISLSDLAALLTVMMTASVGLRWVINRRKPRYFRFPHSRCSGTGRVGRTICGNCKGTGHFYSRQRQLARCTKCQGVCLDDSQTPCNGCDGWGVSPESIEYPPFQSDLQLLAK